MPVSLMTAERCTHMAGATPFLDGLLAAAERADTRLPDLKVFICGGASVPPSLIRRAAGYFERAAVTPGVRIDGSAGHDRRAHCGDLEHAADTDGRRASPTSSWSTARSVPAARRCWSATCIPRTRPRSFDDEGFFRTGDLGRWVDDEYLVVTGRAKDIIIRNGENISPKEIEDILVGHPGIAEIAVVGVPDERTGERACAVIVAAASAGTRP